MGIWFIILLGLVQGLTEFIPVSSSGHLEIVEQVFDGMLGGTRPEDFHFFLELINFGTLLALIIYFWPRILKIFRDIFVKRNFKLAINIIITCIPAGIAGLLLSNFIETNGFFSSLYTIAIAMGVVGVLMIIIDKLPSMPKLKSEKELSKPRALGIGLAQVFALIPGVSRSGSTILAGRVAGLNSRAAAEYSFLVSIPLMSAVCLKTLVSSSAREYLFSNLGILSLSNLVALISGLFAIKFVLKYLKKPDSLKTFGWYRVILGSIVLIFVLLA